jgi:tetratricopeptide (TPR) repeat protein
VKSAVFRVGVDTVAQLILVMALALLAAACNQTGLTPSPVPNPVTGQNLGDVKYYPSDQPVRLGTQRFYDGNFGLAQQYFQDAVEKSPEDVMAWIGLAASYDRLGRFDLADHAYGAAAKLEGETPRLLNNEGYSYMLRGDLKAARAKFKQALRLDPNNQTTLNNIKLLNSSQNFIDRSPSGEPCGSVDCGSKGRDAVSLDGSAGTALQPEVSRDRVAYLLRQSPSHGRASFGRPMVGEDQGGGSRRLARRASLGAF